MRTDFLFEHRPTRAERGETMQVSEEEWRRIEEAAERQREEFAKWQSYYKTIKK